MSTRFFRGLALSVVIVVGLSSVVVPQSASAKQAQQLSTCLNLATGANRVLVRGACDSVLEMTQVWDQVAADEPVEKFFSARTLALAVLLNTGGDVSKFTKKDWASLVRLQALNQSKASGAVRIKTVDDKEVRAVVTTCVKNKTNAIRVVNSGGCDNRIETQRRWVSLDPLQKPVIDQGAPGVPVIEGVRTVGATTRSVTVQPPAKTGNSPIKSITVIAIPGGRWVTIGGGEGGTATFTGLSPDITYTFLAVAVNDSGTGPRIPVPVSAPESEPSSTPDPTPTPTPTPSPSPSPSPSGGTGTGGGSPVTVTAPGAPTSVVATAGSGQASVAFTAPASTGGASITSYTVTSSPPGFTASGSSSPIVVTGLTNGTAYTFTVTATNSVGTGSASVASSGVTPKLSQSITFANPGVKSFGTTPTLTATSDSTLTVSFTSSTTGVCTITSGGALTFVTAGTCTINADQTGNATTLVAPQVTHSFTVSAVVPGAPTIGTATASSGQTSVAFTAPASTGGASITSYTVTSSSGGPTASGSSSPIVVTGLTNGTAYTFTVTATNSVGTGSASVASSGVTPKFAQTITFANPGTINFGTTPTLTATSTSALTVAFTSSTTGVCTITSGGALTFVTAGTCTINADQAGDSSNSAAPQVTQSFTVAPIAPGAPTIGAAAVAGGTSATVAFTAPASTGGASITSYTVTSSPGGFTASGSSSPIVVTGLTTGTAYTFTVTATTSAGTSIPSGSSGAVTPAYILGSTGPGGGLVFLISGGKTYEMAPKNWNGAASDPQSAWCNVSTDVRTGNDIGTGAANTVLMDAACTSGAGQSAADYSANGRSDWFLPSEVELNAMCNYSRNPAAPALTTVRCQDINVAQDASFATSTYGFNVGEYWTSSQDGSNNALYQIFLRGNANTEVKTKLYLVRPIRAF